MNTNDMLAGQGKRSFKNRALTGNQDVEMFRDPKSGDGVFVSSAAFAIPLDGGVKVHTVVPNLGADKLMQLRRRMRNGKPPLSIMQRRKLHANRQAAKQAASGASDVRSPEDRLRAMLAECETAEEKKAIIAAWEKTHGELVSLAPTAVAARQDVPAREVRDLTWLHGILVSIRDGLQEGLLNATEAAEQRMKAVQSFDVSQIPDREVLDAMTHGLVASSRKLLTPQERATLLGRLPPSSAQEPGPEAPPPAPAGPASPIKMAPEQFGAAAAHA